MNTLATAENSRVKGQSLSTNSALDHGHLRIRVDLGSARAPRAVAVAPPATSPVVVRKDRRKLKTFNFQSISIPYGEYRSGRVHYWMMFYYKDRKRVRESRSSFTELKARAEEVSLALANQRTAMLDFGEDDRAEYLLCKKQARDAGVALSILVAEAVEARKNLSRAKFVPKPCPEIVAALLDVKRREKSCGKKWLRSLEGMLNRLAAYWSGPLHLIKAHDLNAWLRELPGGLVYRRHHLVAAKQLIGFGKAANHVPREWDEFDHVQDPEPGKVTIKTWTPDQLVKLLGRTHENMIPFTALQAFAGVRHEELRPDEDDKAPLDWSDFDWEQKHISISQETGKTGARIIPMSDNLIAWLKPYVKPSGPVCEISNPSNALSRAKHRAGLPGGKGDSRNVLRKSFISYRLAIVKNIGWVADEAGNSPAKIKSNYRKPKSERDAKRWFDIHPTTADILQLNLAGV